MIRFLINHQQHQIDSIDPNLSVLSYLRDHLSLTGTKEGCASGDCGACTVVIGEAHSEGIAYRSINACITPLATLHDHSSHITHSLAEPNRKCHY